MIYYINVVLPVASEGVYTYAYGSDVPEGCRVKVPIGSRQAVGISLGSVPKPSFECREILEVLEPFPLFHKKWISFLKKMACYYTAPLGLTLNGIISKKILESQREEKSRSVIFSAENITLSQAQQSIVDAVHIDGYSAHLLDGVTGSGKTEIYLEIAKKALNRGQNVIYLVPEIALTPQLTEKISERLGAIPLRYHSKLTPKQRNESFWSFALESGKLLLGPRSALFVPSEKIGLIIVDEEHETTYKQEEAPAYNLRDMAVLFASICNIPVILGSATPQAESYANAISGKYNLHCIHCRHGETELPEISIIDGRNHDLAGGIISEPLYDKLYETVKSGNQAIIFMNRKGYATSLYCNNCGTLQECRNCSVPVTLYKNGSCACHYCGELYRNLTCSQCGSSDIKETGSGTEKIEEFIESMFPDETLRIDAAKIKTLKSLNNALENFKEKKAKILIGTQLIAKGLHFPDVTFVGIMGIDNILAMPDFRATEKAYQLIMQVSGRAGRGSCKGNVYIQTCMPENPLFQIVTNSPGTFYEYELEKRQQMMYPPYAKLARVIFSYYKEDVLIETALKICGDINLSVRKNAVILGPAPAVIYKIKNNKRYSLLIKTHSNKEMGAILDNMNFLYEKYKTGTLKMKIDRDPYFFL